MNNSIVCGEYIAGIKMTSCSRALVPKHDCMTVSNFAVDSNTTCLNTHFKLIVAGMLKDGEHLSVETECFTFKRQYLAISTGKTFRRYTVILSQKKFAVSA